MARIFLAAVALAATISSAPADQVRGKIEVEASADKAWAAISDFCAIRDWHPEITSCKLANEGKSRVRILNTRDGATMVEIEMARSDPGRVYSYRTVESPLPVENFVSTLRILPLEPGKVDILWLSSYKPVGSAEAAQKALLDLVNTGLASLKAKLEAR